MRSSHSPLQPDLFALPTKATLESSQWTFGDTCGKDVYELRLNLATPAVVTAEKATAPVIGLPTLDGFLSYVAFRAALGNALKTNPELSTELIWQWNIALRHADMWIDFQLPLRAIPLTGEKPLFDCSVGLPVSREGDVLIPYGSGLFTNGCELTRYPEVVDTIPLRKRMSAPLTHPTVRLKGKLDRGSGATKALDNLISFPLTRTYAFFFRGDKEGVERLLKFAIDERIGMGKKTTLGYGQIADVTVTSRPDVTATWAKPLSGPFFCTKKLALMKNLPYARMFARREMAGGQNQELFGCDEFRFVAINETFGAYRPPYWLREQRTQIVRYGSIIQAK